MILLNTTTRAIVPTIKKRAERETPAKNLGAVFGAISASTGILLSGYLKLPTGPIVVFAGVTVFTATVLAKWKTRGRRGAIWATAQAP